jgi:hypothetical protein
LIRVIVTMKYGDGHRVAVGDHVKLWDDHYGTIVCSIDTGEYTDDYPKPNWTYLNTGVLIKPDSGELFHYNEADEDFELVRASVP